MGELSDVAMQGARRESVPHSSKGKRCAIIVSPSSGTDVRVARDKSSISSFLFGLSAN